MQPEYAGHTPYSVVPIFENAEEHKDFIEFVKSHEIKFMDSIGKFDSSDIYYGNPDYIEYLCKAGETLVSWLECWRSRISR